MQYPAAFEMLDDVDRDRFIMVYDDVWHVLANSTALTVYMTLMRRVNADRKEWYGTYKELAKEAGGMKGMHPDTFKRGVERLEELGLVVVTERFAPNNWDYRDASKIIYGQRTKTHPQQIGNLFQLRFHVPSPENMQAPPRTSAGTPPCTSAPPPPCTSAPQTYIPLDVDTKDTHTRTPLAPQGEAAAAAESEGHQVFDAEFVDDTTAGTDTTEDTTDQQTLNVPAVQAPKVPEKPKKAPAAKAPKDYTPEFEAFWASYPPRPNRNKFKTFQTWHKVLTNPEINVTADQLIHAARETAAFNQVNGTNPRFISLPTTWLNARGWENELFIDQTTHTMTRAQFNALPDAARDNIQLENELPW